MVPKRALFFLALAVTLLAMDASPAGPAGPRGAPVASPPASGIGSAARAAAALPAPAESIPAGSLPTNQDAESLVPTFDGWTRQAGRRIRYAQVSWRPQRRGCARSGSDPGCSAPQLMMRRGRDRLPSSA